MFISYLPLSLCMIRFEMLVKAVEGLGADVLAESEYNGQKFKLNDLVDVINMY